MKHQVFVSISEFIANGGILTDNRDLFVNHRNNFICIGCYESSKQIKGLEGDVTITQSGRSFQGNAELVLVSVEATPIYK